MTPTKLSTGTEERATDLAESVLHCWNEAHGGSGGVARALEAPHGLVVYIEDALSQAERVLAQEGDDELLHLYLEKLLQQVCAEREAEVQQRLGRPVVSSGVSIDTARGWILCVFNLGPREARPEEPSLSADDA